MPAQLFISMHILYLIPVADVSRPFSNLIIDLTRIHFPHGCVRLDRRTYSLSPFKSSSMSIGIEASLHDYEKKLVRDLSKSFLYQDFISGFPDLSPESQVRLLHSWPWTRELAEDAFTASRKVPTQLRQSGALREDTHENTKQEVGDASLQWPNDAIISGESLQSEQLLAVEITSILQSWESVTTFEIWSLVQMCCTILRSSDDTSRKLRAALSDCKFSESHLDSVENTCTMETWNTGPQKCGSIINIASPQTFILLDA
ncbi:hypothetical protein J3F84DRAFT_147297 [Trichoderma pleuroticola]